MKFNTKTKTVSRKKPDTVNFEGEPSYSKSTELDLYSLVVTASLSDKFYETQTETINRLKELITKTDPVFVCQLAIYCREQMYLRSVPLVIVLELNKYLTEQNLRDPKNKMISKVLTRIIQRADEITETLAYYQKINEDNAHDVKVKGHKLKKKLCKLSKQVQKGVADSFLKFDEYQFGKYSQDTEIKLKDALFLTHPNPVMAAQEELFKKIASGTLAVPKTWEVELSKAGQDKKDKKIVWQELIDSNVMGYMATLRNLRNILQAGVTQTHIIKVAKYLSDKEQVLKSKQFPFRFLSAYKELIELNDIDLQHKSMILEALEIAVTHSINNLQGFDYDTSILIACDVSGSMQHSISDKSKIEYYDIGLLLGMLVQSKCKNVITGIFGDTWSVETLPKTSILKNVIDLHRIEGKVGYSTNGYLILEYLIKNKKSVDKIFMFTDCQLWNSSFDRTSSGRYRFNSSAYDSGNSYDTLWKEYKKINPNAKLYLFDVSGYQTTPVRINPDNVFLIAGWNEKVFDVLQSIEKGEENLSKIKEIKW